MKGIGEPVPFFYALSPVPSRSGEQIKATLSTASSRTREANKKGQLESCPFPNLDFRQSLVSSAKTLRHADLKRTTEWVVRVWIIVQIEGCEWWIFVKDVDH